MTQLPPQNSLPVLAWYQPFGPAEHPCAVVASFMEVGPQAEGRWLVAESQEWLPWPVTAWAPLPNIPREPGQFLSYPALTTEAGQLCEEMYYIRNALNDLGKDLGLQSERREQLIVTLNQLAFETQELAKAFIACRD